MNPPILGTQMLSLDPTLWSVTPPLPAYALEDAVLEPAAIKQRHKEWQAQGRQRTIDERKIRLCHPRIEPEKRAQPEQCQHPSRAQPFQAVSAHSRVPEFIGQYRKSKKKTKIQRPEDGQHQRVIEEQFQVLGPALDHRPRAAVHACGDRIVGIAETQSYLAPLGQERQLYIFQDLAGH